MKTAFSACLLLIVLSTALFSQPGVERVGWLPYWGEFYDLAIKDSVAFVVNDYGLISFDISDPTEPEILDHSQIIIDYTYPIVEIDVIGDIVNVYTKPLHRFDASDPGDLRILPEIEAPSDAASIQKDDYLYSMTEDGVLYITDVSDPHHPDPVDTIEFQCRSNYLMVKDSLLIAENWIFGYFGLYFISLHNPELPELIGRFFSDEIGFVYNYNKPKINGRLLFNITQCNWNEYSLNCFDFSDPTNPYLRWSRETEYGNVTGFMNEHLAVTVNENNDWVLKLFSIEDPDTLTEIGTYENIFIPNDIKLRENLLYISSYDGLFCYNCENLDNLEYIGGFRSRTLESGICRIDDYLITSLNDSSIRVISVENPENPQEVDSFHLEEQIHFWFEWTSQDSFVYAIGIFPPCNASIWELNENAELNIVGSIELHAGEEANDTDRYSFAPWENGIVMTMSFFNEAIDSAMNYLKVVSLDNPANPEIIGALSFQEEGYESGFFWNIKVNGNYVYIPNHNYFNPGSYVISIEDPAHPEIVAHQQRNSFMVPIEIEFDLMIAGGDSRLNLFSLADPANPQFTGEFARELLWPSAIAIQHGLVAANSYSRPNFFLFNVRNLDEPYAVDSLDLYDLPSVLSIEDGYIYAIEPSGIEILRYTGADSAPEAAPYMPESIRLNEPYPNPFNSSTKISYYLPVDSQAKLSVTDLAGREVLTLEECWLKAGEHESAIDASALPSGVYVVRLEAGGTVRAVKMACIR